MSSELKLVSNISLRRDPIFVVGYGRSGTTLLQHMLSAHPDICIAPEQHEFALYDLDLLTNTVWNARHIFIDISDKNALREAVRSYASNQKDVLFAYYCLAWAAKYQKTNARWGDKYTANWQFMPALAAWYPQAQFIHIVREPRDVVSSIIQHFPQNIILPQKVVPAHVNLAWRWRRSYRTAARQGRSLGPNRYMTLKYEDFVSDPESHLKEICSFLNISFHQCMLSTHKMIRKGWGNAPVSGTHDELKKPTHTKKIGRHAKYLSAKDVRDIEIICHGEMKELNYNYFASGQHDARVYQVKMLSAFFEIGWRGVRLSRKMRGRL